MRLSTLVLGLSLVWLVLAGALAMLPVDPLTRLICVGLGLVPLAGHLAFPYQTTRGTRRTLRQKGLASSARPVGPTLLPTDPRFSSSLRQTGGDCLGEPLQVGENSHAEAEPTGYPPVEEAPGASAGAAVPPQNASLPHTPVVLSAPSPVISPAHASALVEPSRSSPHSPQRTRPFILPAGLVPLPLDYLFRTRQA